jgi:hypothetical protein
MSGLGSLGSDGTFESRSFEWWLVLEKRSQVVFRCFNFVILLRETPGCGQTEMEKKVKVAFDFRP